MVNLVSDTVTNGSLMLGEPVFSDFDYAWYESTHYENVVLFTEKSQ